MLGVCFCFYKLSSLRAQWMYLLTGFQVEQRWEIAVDGQGDQASLDHKITTIRTADELPTDLPLVLIQPRAGDFLQGTESLADFIHPTDAIYLFGSDGQALSEVQLGARVPDSSLYIPLPINAERPHDEELYSVQAAAIALYDRIAKGA